MRKIDINDLIQLLGMLGIIGSPIFVGIEMRRSQRIAQAGQQQDRTASFLAFLAQLTSLETMNKKVPGYIPDTFF